jgi:GDSL-like Lipase/Acylhydrolase family
VDGPGRRAEEMGVRRRHDGRAAICRPGAAWDGAAVMPNPRRENGLATALLLVVCVLGGIPLVIWLTPHQQLSVAGQHLSVGARAPSLSLVGPARLVQIGNTELDIARLRVYGPLRPELTVGPVERDALITTLLEPQRRHTAQAEAVHTLGAGFARWYGWATVLLLAFLFAATAAVASVRLLVALRRLSRQEHHPVTAVEVWHRMSRQIRRMAALALGVSLLAWIASGTLAYAGAVRGLRDVRSLSDLVGNYYLSPSPVGPPVSGYQGAVIGDSRASRVGGPVVPDADEDDQACVRSTDSLAAELGHLLDTRVLNLACPGASITEGLREPQQQGGRTLPAQVGRLKQVQDLDFVVVVIGPNDLFWGDFLAYCYTVDICRDNLTNGEFDYRLAAFDRSYGDLLRDLNDLPGSPQVIVMTSYDAFAPDADCADTRGPAGSQGLSPQNIALLADRNAQLNRVLVTGAERYGFDVARPQLAPLCAPDTDGLGPDLQGLRDPHPFHPTGIGMIRLAAAVAHAVRPL